MSQCINMACIGRETHGIGNSWDVTPPHMWLYKDICQLKMGVRFLITRIWFWCVVLSSFHQTGTAAWYTSSAACNPPPYETLIHSPRLCCWDLNGSIRKVNDKPEKPTAVHQQYIMQQHMMRSFHELSFSTHLKTPASCAGSVSSSCPVQ
jgi:hypothetical protein